MFNSVFIPVELCVQLIKFISQFTLPKRVIHEHVAARNEKNFLQAKSCVYCI